MSFQLHASRLIKSGHWLALLWLLLCLPLTWFDAQNRWITPDSQVWVGFKIWLYWAVWAAIPLFIARSAMLLVHLQQAPSGRGIWHRLHGLSLLLGLGVLALGIHASLIEPRRLLVQTHRFALPAGSQALRLALVSDLHLGIFWREPQLRQLIERLNALEVDAVLVAGDWTYEPPHDLDSAFAPLKELRHPVYGVPGNHDLRSPGADYDAFLRKALARAGVTLLDGTRTQLKGWEIVGIGDKWGSDTRGQIAQLLQSPSRTRLVLTHQPDTAADFPAGTAFLTLAGHTHAGQIRLPVLTGIVLRKGTEHPWYHGTYTLPKNGQLFVTGGVGTIGLPARLGVPPRIELLEIQ